MIENQKVCFYCLLLLVSLVDPLLDLVLEAALGYAGAIGTSLMDELASLNERCDSSVVDVKMEDLDRRIVALTNEGIRDREVVRMMRVVSQTQELLTKIHTICVEIRDIRRTSQKQYITTPLKDRDKDSPKTTDNCYSSPPHKEEVQDDKPDCSHTASTSLSLSSPPTDSSDIRTRCVGEEASSPATYPSEPPSPSPPHATLPDLLSPSGDAFELADGDPKGYTTGPDSAGIQMDAVLEGRIEGRIPSSDEPPPEKQVWKD